MSDDDEGWMIFAEGKMACPECNELIPVPIKAKVTLEAGDQILETAPDMTELWAHTWTHRVSTGEKI